MQCAAYAKAQVEALAAAALECPLDGGWIAGGHHTPREIVRESLEWFLGPQKAPKAQQAE